MIFLTFFAQLFLIGLNLAVSTHWFVIVTPLVFRIDRCACMFPSFGSFCSAFLGVLD